MLFNYILYTMCFHIVYICYIKTALVRPFGGARLVHRGVHRAHMAASREHARTRARARAHVRARADSTAKHNIGLHRGVHQTCGCTPFSTMKSLCWPACAHMRTCVYCKDNNNSGTPKAEKQQGTRRDAHDLTASERSRLG